MEDPKVIYLGPACQKEGDGREWCEDDVWPQCECGCSSIRYVLESDAQSELAALREELAEVSGTLEFNTNCWGRERAVMIDKNQVLQQRLTAAEQRNALMVELLTEHQWEWEPYDSHTHRDGGYYCVECQEPKASGHEAGCKLAAALQPTESGASEPQCLLCLDAKTVQGNIHGGFVKDCPDCCSEEG